jgi:hypothetical protein
MQLFIVVGILLVIDFAIMTTWQLLDPFYRETKNMTKYVRFSLNKYQPLIHIRIRYKSYIHSDLIYRWTQ